MLPDYPEVKRFLAGHVQKFMEQVDAKEMGILSDVPKTFLHEGGAQVLFRSDGSQTVTRLKEIDAMISFDQTEYDTLTLPSLFRKAKEAAQRMAGKKWGISLEAMDDACTDVGNVVQASGRPITEVLLENLSKLELEFDESGNPVMPTALVGTPAQAEIIRRGWLTIMREPKLNKRFEAILLAQKEAWRDRESDRELAG